MPFSSCRAPHLSSRTKAPDTSVLDSAEARRDAEYLDEALGEGPGRK
jgi:hypothetical protein